MKSKIYKYKNCSSTQKGEEGERMEEIQGKRPVRDYLADELKRLNRINDKMEKNVNIDNVFNEPEQKIVNNVLAMCQIANTIKYF